MFLLFVYPAFGFFEAFFEQAFHFGGGSFQGSFNIGSGRPEIPSWPANYPTTIDPAFNALKGTEWLWSDWKPVKFHADGKFEAPAPECSTPGACKWSANADKVFILWGSAGVHWLATTGRHALTVGKLPTMSFAGKRERDNAPIYMRFMSVFEDQDLWALFGMKPDEVVGSDVLSELKKRYRRLTLELHPDKVGKSNETAAVEFRRVTDAYETLSDPIKRFIYDLHGRDGLRKLERGEFPKADSRLVEIRVPLDVVYSGGEVSVELTRRVVCGGGRTTTSCSKCPSEVQTVNRQVGPGFYMQQQVRVDSKHHCKQQTTQETISISRGLAEGAELTLVGKADESPNSLPGDVVVRVYTKPHSDFKRLDQIHLILSKPIKLGLVEALLGFSRDITLPDGVVVEVGPGVDSSTVTPHGTVFNFEGKGLGDGGELRVPVEVLFPKKLTPNQKKLVAEAFD